MTERFSALKSAYARLQVADPQARALPYLLVAIFSLLYFAETLVRASEKPFWFDELCTFYIVRLPTFADSWSAVLHGADFNPPLFYLIQRAARSLFGEGPIAMRIPSIFGFWIFSLCLFRFAAKSAGPLAGWIAMVMPALTGAYYYAYEARPHGIVLGFCGLALVCWQETEREGPRRALWRLGFAAFLGAAFFTHCYALVIAIPFGIVELARTVRFRSIRLWNWIALFSPAIAAVISFIPLLRSYRQTVSVSGFAVNDQFSAAWSQIPAFYIYLLSPCVILAVCILVLYSLAPSGGVSGSTDKGKTLSWPNTLLVCGFLAMPVYGLLLAKLSRGPYFARYFMTAVIGVALTIALGSRTGGRKIGPSLMLAVALGGVLMLHSSLVVLHRYNDRSEPLIEPSTGWPISTPIGNPLANYRVLIFNSNNSLPIVIVPQVDFLYLVHNWPSNVSRLYTVSVSTRDLAYQLYRALRLTCHPGYNAEETYAEFLPSHPDFLFYGAPWATPLLEFLGSQGAEIKSLNFGDGGTFVAQIHLRTALPGKERRSGPAS